MFRSATLGRIGRAAAVTGHFDRSQRIKMILPMFEPNPNLFLANRPYKFLPAAAVNGARPLSTAAESIPLYGAGSPEAGPGTGGEVVKHKNISVTSLRTKQRKGQPISMVTAYDYPSAQAADVAGLDIVLVGDSVGMVVLGYDSTTEVTMDEMLHHCKAVARGTRRPFLVGDLPFGSYLTPADAARNAVRLVKEGNMDCVKLEGGRRMADRVRAITDAGINVMGHIGLTPQTAASLGGYRVQGKSAKAAQELVEDALALQEAGCHAVVLECVPDRVAAHCTEVLDIPTIGIGAGPHTSGQVQVFHDVVGLYDKLQPKFSRQYIQAGDAMAEALRRFTQDVASRDFPNAAESFTMTDEHYNDFQKLQQPEGQVMLQEEIRELRRSLKMRLEMLEALDTGDFPSTNTKTHTTPKPTPKPRTLKKCSTASVQQA